MQFLTGRHHGKANSLQKSDEGFRSAGLVSSVALGSPGVQAFTLNIVGSYRWLLEEDLTYQIGPREPSGNQADRKFGLSEIFVK
jgi:hypothetical protein